MWSVTQKIKMNIFISCFPLFSKLESYHAFFQLVIKPSHISVCHMQKLQPPVHLANFARGLNSEC